MNTKIKQYIEEKELRKKETEIAIAFSKFEPYLEQIKNGDVVTYDEIIDALELRLINDYHDQTRYINQLIDLFAKQKGITITNEKGCYALAESTDYDCYKTNERHEKKALLAFRVFLITIIALFTMVISQISPTAWLSEGLIGLAVATLSYSLYHTFHTQNIILLGKSEVDNG